MKGENMDNFYRGTPKVSPYERHNSAEPTQAMNGFDDKSDDPAQWSGEKLKLEAAREDYETMSLEELATRVNESVGATEQQKLAATIYRRRMREFEESDEQKELARLEGMTPEEIRAEESAKIAATLQKEWNTIATSNADAFIRDNPQYSDSKANSDAMQAFLTRRGLPPTRDNLQFAFEVLLSEGKVKLKRKAAEIPEEYPSETASREQADAFYERERQRQKILQDYPQGVQ